LVFVQITRRTPLRRTILQFSQMRLTLLRTFMTEIPYRPAKPAESAFIAKILPKLKRGPALRTTRPISKTPQNRKSSLRRPSPAG
jgi:hypothetical protein